MVRIEMIELTDEHARYKYFPENSEAFGIIKLNRLTNVREFEKTVSGYSMNYAAHAIRRIEEYNAIGTFKEKDIVAWC